MMEAPENTDQAGKTSWMLSMGQSKAHLLAMLCNMLFGVSFGVSSMLMASTLCVPQVVAYCICTSLTQGDTDKVK